MKDLFWTKTFWTGLASIVTGVGLIMAGDIPAGLNQIAIGVVGICVRDGILKMSK